MRRMYSENQLQEITKEQLAEGNVNNVKIFENIVDKDGHPRFIEADITPEEITGVTYTYAKWALSGTHLTIVVAGNAVSGTSVAWGNLANINLPQWIKDKIIPSSASANTYVAGVNVVYVKNDLSSQNSNSYLRKDSGQNKIFITITMPTLTADASFRVAFDLLIDNE